MRQEGPSMSWRISGLSRMTASFTIDSTMASKYSRSKSSGAIYVQPTFSRALTIIFSVVLSSLNIAQASRSSVRLISCSAAAASKAITSCGTSTKAAVSTTFQSTPSYACTMRCLMLAMRRRGDAIAQIYAQLVELPCLLPISSRYLTVPACKILLIPRA